MQAFARSLEIIPKQLADNSGMDSTDVLNSLRKCHAVKTKPEDMWIGVNVLGGRVENLYDLFVWEPELVRLNVI